MINSEINATDMATGQDTPITPRSGILTKRTLPGRQRAAGFLESDVNSLLAGKDGV